jgi:tetratricopeptide (TPR) repeat protein
VFYLAALVLLAGFRAGGLAQALGGNAAMHLAKLALAEGIRQPLPGALPYLASPFWQVPGSPRLAQAEAALNALEPYTPHGARTLRRLGVIALAQGERGAARDAFSRALARDAADGWTRWSRGWSAALVGDAAAAMADWPNTGMAEAIQAECLVHLNGNAYAQARDCLALAAALDPQDWLALWRLSTAHRRLGETDASLEYLRQAAQRVPPETVEYFLIWGELREQEGGDAEAIALYRRAIQEGWADYRAWRHLGRLLSAQAGGAAEAEQALRQSIRLNPCGEGAYRYLIALYRQNGQEARAGEVEGELERCGE